MLKKLILENWKSFRYAELYFDPLTVLIGTNASGKSNLVEALEFLRRMATGETVDVALNGDRSLSSIRGGSQWAVLRSEHGFLLNVLIEGNKKQDYSYHLQVDKSPFIWDEHIRWNNLDNGLENKITLFSAINFDQNQRSGLNRDRAFYMGADTINSHKYMVDGIINPYVHDKLSSSEFMNEIKKNIYEPLQKILIINPIPLQMRDFSRLSETIEQDTSNIAGVLAALPDEQKAEIESTLSHYLEHFPEGDIKKVWAEKVGRLGTDAMLYCQEEWQPGQITEIDARSMSDGTLRLLGILTALLTRPEGSLIVIEEIDNGLHPSRAELLVKILREIGTKRKIDLLITTHNPALLDALGPEIIPFVTVVHRDAETGESQLTLLEDIENLPKLLATGSLGKLATKGTIEKTLAKSI
ncbi:MAG: AAA family ATPase [Snowella sp.]|nr:AAA family ATPase [Snowella sp.]